MPRMVKFRIVNRRGWDLEALDNEFTFIRHDPVPSNNHRRGWEYVILGHVTMAAGNRVSTYGRLGSDAVVKVIL